MIDAAARALKRGEQNQGWGPGALRGRAARQRGTGGSDGAALAGRKQNLTVLALFSAAILTYWRWIRRIDRLDKRRQDWRSRRPDNWLHSRGWTAVTLCGVSDH